MDDIGSNGKLHLTNITNGNCIGASWGLDYTRERTVPAILRVHTHLERSVVRPMPEFDVGVEWATLSAKDNLKLIHIRRTVTPSSEGTTLNELSWRCTSRHYWLEPFCLWT